jgi:hypothetical protein
MTLPILALKGLGVSNPCFNCACSRSIAVIQPTEQDLQKLKYRILSVTQYLSQQSHSNNVDVL